MKKSISIIIPAYNAEKTIAETLKSLQSQSSKDFKVILIDDGSIDNTLILANTFKDKLDIDIYSQNNMGEGQARNTGISHLDTSYCLFLDADDHLEQNAIEIFKKYIDKKFEIIFCGYKKIMENKISKYVPPSIELNNFELISLFYKRQITFGIGNTLIKSSLIRENNILFEEYKLGADNHFFRKLALYANKSIAIKDILFNYKINTGSVTSDKNLLEHNYDSVISVYETLSYLLNEKHYRYIRYCNVFLLNEIRGKITSLSKDSVEDIISLIPKCNLKDLIGYRLKFSLANIFFYLLPKTYIFIFNTLKFKTRNK